MTAVEELEAAHAKAIRKLEKEKKRAIKAATDEVESAHLQAIKSLEAERHAAVSKVTEGLEVAHRKIVQRLEDALKEAIEKNDLSNDKSINKKESADSVTLEPRQNESDDNKKKSESTPSFPFETDPDDHCESPLQAYEDIVNFLQAYKGKPQSKLSIYDPYFCNGAVVRNLASLGFGNVYNRKEDCYEVWKTPSKIPSHDILITNPPYSDDHIEKLISHVTSPAFGQRPWFLLLPQFVHKKEYFLRLTANIQPFYLVPKKRYVYLPPPSFREAKKSDVHKKSSPFVSMWFIWGGTNSQNHQWLALAKKISSCEVARSKSALRDLRRKGTKRKRG